MAKSKSVAKKQFKITSDSRTQLKELYPELNKPVARGNNKNSGPKIRKGSVYGLY